MPLFNLMEDAATAEISRSQLWQWLHHGAKLEGSDAPITAELLAQYAQEELETIRKSVGDAQFNAVPYTRAHALVMKLTNDKNYAEFLTLPAYEVLAD